MSSALINKRYVASFGSSPMIPSDSSRLRNSDGLKSCSFCKLLFAKFDANHNATPFSKVLELTESPSNSSKSDNPSSSSPHLNFNLDKKETIERKLFSNAFEPKPTLKSFSDGSGIRFHCEEMSCN